MAPDEPAAVAIHRALSSGVQRLRASEAPARRREPEGIHRMRTSARRLRSVLRTFQELLEPTWAEALEDELKWLGQRLGEVRDLDVLQDRLATDAGDARPALEPLFESLRVRTEASRRALDEALDGARFQELMARLADAADRPRLRDEAWQPCRSALPGLVRKAWKRLKQRGRDLREDDPDEAFHEVRKRAKSARYAAEAVANALGADTGRDAERFADQARGVQDILGAHQDAIVAGSEVTRIMVMFRDDRPFQEAAKSLCSRLDDSAQQSRDRFFKAWRKFDRKKLRRWLEK
ncbi:MAG: CHAD domain-containing protein [Isosphaeraceae bacterium]|nr:CHAD domain-containing protein [Isosphaeraceae bacterium]